MNKKNNDGNNLETQILIHPKRSSSHDQNIDELQILFQPNIGLARDIRVLIVEMLNNSLANESVLSQKTRSAHWNGSGPGFLELHIFFESQYKQLNEIVDKIAERTKMLGGIALGSLAEFLEHTQIEDKPADIPDVIHLLADHEKVVRLLREDIRKCSEEYEDEGTAELLVGVLSLHEKMAWMLRSYIEPRPVTA
jgi:starvation-inducible DNA-binding protein